MNVRKIFLLLVVVTSGCASVAKDSESGNVELLLRERGLILESKAARRDREVSTNVLLSQPLSVDQAVQVGLANSPDARKVFASLTLGTAEIDSASSVRNPVFSIANLSNDQSGARDLRTLGLFTSLSDFITLPARRRAAVVSFEALQHTAGVELMAFATDTAKAYFEYVAGIQISKLATARAELSTLAESLAKQFYAAGNISKRDLAELQVSASKDRIAALSNFEQLDALRAALANNLGVSTAADWSAGSMLAPRSAAESVDEQLRFAAERRLDLLAANQRAAAAARRAGIADWSRWIGDIDIGVESERETDGLRSEGPSIELELPVFGQRRADVRRANAVLEMAAIEVAQIQLQMENDIRHSFTKTETARTKFDEIREHLLPASESALTRAQEEQNFMLIGVFELIEAKKSHYDAYRMLVEAALGYWLAETSLAAVSGAGLTAAERPKPLDMSGAYRAMDSAVEHRHHKRSPKNEKHTDVSGNDGDSL